MSDFGELRALKTKPPGKPAPVRHEWYVVCSDCAFIVKAEYCAPHEEDSEQYTFMNDPHHVVWAGHAKTIYLNEHPDVQVLETVKENNNGK